MLFVVGAALLILIIILCSRSSSKFSRRKGLVSGLIARRETKVAKDKETNIVVDNLKIIRDIPNSVISKETVPVYENKQDKLPKNLNDAKAILKGILDLKKTLNDRLTNCNVITYINDGKYDLYNVPFNTNLQYKDKTKQVNTMGPYNPDSYYSEYEWYQSGYWYDEVVPAVTFRITGNWPNVQVVSTNKGIITTPGIKPYYSSSILDRISDNPVWIVSEIYNQNKTYEDFNAISYFGVSGNYKLYTHINEEQLPALTPLTYKAISKGDKQRTLIVSKI
jgi:hypothetical protein